MKLSSVVVLPGGGVQQHLQLSGRSAVNELQNEVKGVSGDSCSTNTFSLLVLETLASTYQKGRTERGAKYNNRMEIPDLVSHF